MPSIVSVLGAGWSVRGLDLSKLPGLVIGVNDTGIIAPKVDAIVSMDRLWTENRWNDLKLLKIPTWIRLAALKNIKENPTWLNPFFNSHVLTTPSENWDVLNGTNSGMCAINLAYLWQPEIIILFGFDHCRNKEGRAYWFGEGYPWARTGGGTGNGRYEEWAKQYEVIAEACRNRGIKVFNASPSSAIGSFHKVNPADVLER